MAKSYSELANERVSAANGVDYAYRDTGGEDAVPLVLLQHFRGNLDNWDSALIDTLATTRRVVMLGRLAVLPEARQRGVQFPAGADAELGKYLAQAIACTLDRPAIVQALFQGYADVGNGTPFAPAFPATIGPPAIPQRSKNLKLAKELLAKGGVPNGFSAPLLTEALAEMPDFAQIIQQSARQIGVDISLTVETSSKYYGQAVFGNSDWLDGEMSLVNYGARAVPNIFLQVPLQSINAKTGQGSWNAAHFNNPTYDQLSKEFVATPDLTTQRRLAGQIERLLLDETPIIYAYFYDWLVATQKDITGVYPAITGLFLWNAART